jgi:OOP family OmpA-OmpF porin
LPGISEFRADQIPDADLAAITAAVEAHVIRFAVGTTQFVPGQRESLQALTADVARLDEIGSLIGRRLRLEIVGHTDQSASAETNLRLSQSRAELMARVLGRKVLKMIDLFPVGVGSSEPLRPETTEEGREFNRSVSFRLRTS